MEEKIRKEEIIKRWKESGLLDGLTEMDIEHPMYHMLKVFKIHDLNAPLDIKPVNDSKENL